MRLLFRAPVVGVAKGDEIRIVGSGQRFVVAGTAPVPGGGTSIELSKLMPTTGTAEVLAAFQASMRERGIAVYEAGLRSSDCHGVPFWRVCFGRGRPDVFICKFCHTHCGAVQDDL